MPLVCRALQLRQGLSRVRCEGGQTVSCRVPYDVEIQAVIGVPQTICHAADINSTAGWASPAARPPRASAGSWLEGTPTVPMDAGPQPRLFDRFRQQVHASAKNVPEPTLQRGQTKQGHTRGRIEVGGKIDVAGRLGVGCLAYAAPSM